MCQCPVRPPISALSGGAEVASSSAVGQFDGEQAATAKGAKARRQPCTLVGTIQGSIKVLDPETYEELTVWDAFSAGGSAGRVTHLSAMHEVE